MPRAYTLCMIHTHHEAENVDRSLGNDVCRAASCELATLLTLAPVRRAGLAAVGDCGALRLEARIYPLHHRAKGMRHVCNS